MSRCSDDESMFSNVVLHISFFFQAEDGLRVLVRTRGLVDVYKRKTGEMIMEKFMNT